MANEIHALRDLKPGPPRPRTAIRIAQTAPGSRAPRAYRRLYLSICSAADPPPVLFMRITIASGGVDAW